MLDAIESVSAWMFDNSVTTTALKLALLTMAIALVLWLASRSNVRRIRRQRDEGPED